MGKVSIGRTTQLAAYVDHHGVREEREPLELERKFWYDFDIDAKLAQIGAKKIEQDFGKTISDKYYDHIGSYWLLLNDYLLRMRSHRDGHRKWQLKYPRKGRSNDIEQYVEVNKTQQIIDETYALAAKKNQISLAKQERQISCQTVESLIGLFELDCFARINSKRKSYLLENMKIDLDETDFGYKLGEIEVVLDKQISTTSIQQSIGLITDLTNRLGRFDKIRLNLHDFLFIIFLLIVQYIKALHSFIKYLASFLHSCTDSTHICFNCSKTMAKLKKRSFLI
jgi:adenylate cyclase class IV